MLPPNVQMSHSRAREHVTRDIHCRIYIVTTICIASSIYICHRRMRQEHELSPNASHCPPARPLHWGPNRCTSRPRLPALLAAGACAHHVIHVIWTGSTSTSHSTVCIMCNSQHKYCIVNNCQLSVK